MLKLAESLAQELQKRSKFCGANYVFTAKVASSQQKPRFVTQAIIS